jgi:hypothetical protein
MKHNTITILSAGLLLTSSVLAAVPTAGSHLERGVELMQDAATVQDAVLHFEKVLQNQEQSRKLAAEAHYLLAKCQLQLGDTEKARATVEMLAAGWPADNKWVRKAGSLIPRSSMFNPVPWTDGEWLTYRISVTHEGETFDAGHLHSAMRAGEHQGRKTWTTWNIPSSMDPEFSVIEFDGRDFRPLKGRVVSTPGGDVVIEATADGGVTLRQAKDTDPFLRGKPNPAGTAPASFFHHYQIFELIRLLPDEIGTAVTLPVTAARASEPPVELEVKATRHETITVPAGTFDCVVYETSQEETIWVERAGTRRVIRQQMDPMNLVLVSSDNDWNFKDVIPGGQGAGGASLQLAVPDGMIKFAKPDGMPFNAEGEGERLGLFDTTLRVWGGIVERIPTHGNGPSRAELEEVLPKQSANPRAGTMIKPAERTRKASEPPAGTDTPDPTTRQQAPEAGQESDNPMVQHLQERLMMMGFETSEIAGARERVVDGGTLGMLTRLKLKRVELECERTVLFAFGGDTMTVIHFDHPAGGGDHAASLVKDILKSL